MNAKELIHLEEHYGAHNYHPLDVVIQKGEGIWVYDVDGKKYLDCLSAYSALNQGHRHPKIIQALIDQAQKVTLTSRAFHNDQFGLFCKEICEFTGYEMVLPMNSGAEGVETAIKVARKWAYKTKKIEEDKAEIITCAGNFHGRTVTIVGFSTEPQYKECFGPFTPGFVTVPYGDVESVEKAIHPNTAGILIEPIQGEGGIIVPPEGYLKKVAELCKKHNVLFIADEIQTGLGRTGKLFACEYEDVKADMMILGKALGGGCYPVSAVLASKAVMGVIQPGDHGSTFGGNPLAMAVAREALKVIQNEKLIENAYRLGEYFMGKLREIKSQHVELVRGKGLLIGVLLKKSARGARRFCEALKERGILCKETHEDVIRFAPPLVIEKKDIDWAVSLIDEVLRME